MGHEWKESTICGTFQWRVWNGEREVLGGARRLKIYFIYIYIYAYIYIVYPYINIGGWHNEIH
jgi:hypothetical protein